MKQVRARNARAPARSGKLGFKQTHRLETLPGEIERLGADISKLEALLADPGLFSRDPAKFQKASDALAARQTALAAAEDEWLELEELREAGG
jgi:ATP-binding cassette subfamily F protein uup